MEEAVDKERDEETANAKLYLEPGGKSRRSRKSRKGGKGSGRGKGQELDKSPGLEQQPHSLENSAIQETCFDLGTLLNSVSEFAQPKSNNVDAKTTPAAKPSRKEDNSSSLPEGDNRRVFERLGPSEPREAVSRIWEDADDVVFMSGLRLITPLKSIEDFQHVSLMIDGFDECGIEEFNPLQKAVVPHLTRGDDLFIIGGNMNGKSLSYLIPIVGRLLAEGGSRKQLTSNPSVLIICADVVSANRIKDHLAALLQPRLPPLLQSLNQGDVSFDVISTFQESRETGKLQCGLGLTIAIFPISFFYKMICKYPHRIDFKDLDCLVYEDMHLLTTKYPNEFDFIRGKLIGIAASKGFNYQRVFVGQTWCDDVEQIYNTLNPLRFGNKEFPVDSKERCGSAATLLIYSSNQVIRYSEVGFHFLHAKGDLEKITRVHELLCSVQLYYHKRIVVACSTAGVAIAVYNSLLDNVGMFSLSLAETSSVQANKFNQLTTDWSRCPNDKQQVMVLNDEALMYLNMRNVTCLINYDIPMLTFKSAIGKMYNPTAERFACFSDNIRSIAEEKSIPTMKYTRQVLDTYFLVTGNEPVLAKLCEYGKFQMGSPIPDALNSMVDIVQGKTQGFCRNVKLFGQCHESVCQDRHEILLSEISETPLVPRSGWVDIVVGQCLNPSHYTGRISRFYGANDSKGPRIFDLSFEMLQKILKNLFKCSKPGEKSFHRVPPSTYENGTLCVVKHGPASFFRGRILKIVSRNEKRIPKALRIFCIDVGIFRTLQVEDVYALPDVVNLTLQPQMAVQMILCNLQPTDGPSYSRKIASRAGKVTVGKTLCGNIQFSMGETIWVLPLLNEALDQGNRSLIKNLSTRYFASNSSIRIALIRNDIAYENEQHIRQIVKLALVTGFRCPNLDALDTPMKNPVFMSDFYRRDENTSLSWAHLGLTNSTGLDFGENNEIWATLTITPYLIFGTFEKYNKLREELNEDLDAGIREYVQSGTQFTEWYTLGLVVAVMNRCTEKWARGLITAIRPGTLPTLEDSEYDVFFVDVGTTQINTRITELFPMPRKFVRALPFQVIAFGLGHIIPVSKKGHEKSTWTQATFETLADITTGREADIILNVVAAEKLDTHYDPSSDYYIPCNYYDAVLLTKEGQDIGERLVNEGVAAFNEDEDGQQTVIQARNSFTASFLKANNDGSERQLAAEAMLQLSRDHHALGSQLERNEGETNKQAF